MIQDKIFFDEKDPTGLSYNTPFTVFGSYQGRLWSKAPGGEIRYYTQNSDLSVYATTGSNQFNGNQTVTGSLTVTGGITGTITTASYVQYSNVANKPTLVSGSAQVSFTGITNKPSGIVSSSVQVRGYNVFATTGSNQFNGSQSVTGSLTVTGQVIAQTLNVQEVTSSIVFSSGSNRFGNNSGNTHRFTGSLAVTGAGTFAGSITLSGTNSQLLQTINNSIAGDNAAVFYNSNANSYGLYIGAGSGTNHALYITDSTRTKNLFKVQGNGNVGIGTASPATLLNLKSSTTSELRIESVGGTYRSLIAFRTDGQKYDLGVNLNDTTDAFSINYAGTERMRITSAGQQKMDSDLTSANIAVWWNSSASNPFGLNLTYTGSSPNGTSNNFLYCADSTVPRFVARSNGGVANYQANDVNLSDGRTKKDIEPLESYWDKFKGIEIVKFKYIDQTHDDFNIGVIAQQVESIAPEFVDIDGWDTNPKLNEEEDEILSEAEPLKSIYTSDLHHATIKVLQEAMAKIESLEAILQRNNIS
jgi:hypothetical protein